MTNESTYSRAVMCPECSHTIQVLITDRTLNLSTSSWITCNNCGYQLNIIVTSSQATTSLINDTVLCVVASDPEPIAKEEQDPALELIKKKEEKRRQRKLWKKKMPW